MTFPNALVECGVTLNLKKVIRESQIHYKPIEKRRITRHLDLSILVAFTVFPRPPGVFAPKLFLAWPNIAQSDYLRTGQSNRCTDWQGLDYPYKPIQCATNEFAH